MEPNMNNQLFGVTRTGNAFGQVAGDSGPSTAITGAKDAYGNSTALNTTLQGSLLAPPEPGVPATGIPMPGMSDFGGVGTGPSPVAPGVRSRRDSSPLEKLDQTIAMGNAMGEMSNTERYQMSNPTNAPVTLGGKGGISSVSPGSSADASMLRQQTANMETLRGKLAEQPLYAGTGYAEGGEVKETPEQVMARMNAKYGGTGAAITEKPAAPAPAPAPATTPAPAPEPKKFSGLGGVYNLLSGGRKAQIDKAVDGYACGGKVKGHAEGGEVGFANGGSLDPIYNEQINQARLGNAGNDVHANNPFPAAKEAPRLSFPQPAYEPVAPLQGPAGQFGVPEGRTLPQVGVGKQAAGRTAAVPTSAPAPAQATPLPPTQSAAPVVEPAVTSKPSSPIMATERPNVRMGGVPNSDSTRWFSQGDAGRAAGPGMAPAEPSLPPTDRAKFDAEVRSRIPPKGSPRPEVRPAPTAPTAPAAAQTAEVAAPLASKPGLVRRVIGGVGKIANIAVPAMAAVDALGDNAIKVAGLREDEPGYEGPGINKAIGATKEVALRAGDWGTKGLDLLGGWALPKGEKSFNDAYREGVGQLPGVSAPLSTETAAATPATVHVKPQNANAPLSGSPVTQETPAAAPAPSLADPRFIPDPVQAPMRSGAIRVGPQAQTIQGTSPVDATQLKAPEGGGYITDKSGRTIFLPGGQPSAQPARDPNGHYDAYGNNMAATDQMKAEIRGIQRDRALRNKDYAALAALNSDPELAAENLAKSNMALEQQRSKDRLAEHEASNPMMSAAAKDLNERLASITDPEKRSQFIQQYQAKLGDQIKIIPNEEVVDIGGIPTKVSRPYIMDVATKKIVPVGQQAASATLTPDHLKQLRANPSKAMKMAIDEQYGPGAADKALAGKFAHGGCVGGIGKFAKGGCIPGKAKMASGGEVISGPGNGVSDSIPAHVEETGQPIKVSAGEYELPPAAVAKVGVDRLNELLAKYHQGESRPVKEGSFIIPADVVKRLGRAYFDHMAKQV